MATGTHIHVPSTPFGNKYQSMLEALNTAVVLVRQLKDEADAYTSGGTTTANLETDVNTGFASGDGAAAYTNLVNTKATIDVATITNILKNMRD